MAELKLISDYKPGGDQPPAIEELVAGLRTEFRFQTLLRATGTGRTYTVANVIEKVQRPTLIIAHNKTPARRLRAAWGDLRQ